MSNISKLKKLFIIHYSLFIFLFVLTLFVFPIFQGKIPIPADTILGMYHPWRDKIWDGLTKVPFKNFLITDPVRQQFPWKEFAASLVKQGKPPLWNPYIFSGTPLLANLQSAPFYPLNFLFFLLPFRVAWTTFIVLQQLFGGLFLYFYLRHFKLKKPACLLGCLAWVFSGFFIAWWEWGTIIHTCLWLPLILLLIEKVFIYSKRSKISNKKLMLWSFILVFSLVSSFFAGHLQVSFYILLFSLFYIIAKLAIFNGSRKHLILLFTFHFLLFILLTAIQWLPTLEFILYSSRNFDQVDFTREGWFIPWQNLVQFFAPDFFGNPATLNYWGKWNYAEFVGYIGVIPLIFSLLAVFWRRDKKTLFFSFLVLLSLVFALPTPLAKLPYKLRIPFISTSQPTRLMFIIDFALTVLAALGLDWLFSMNQFIEKRKIHKMGLVLLVVGLVFVCLWSFAFFAPQIWPQADWLIGLSVSKRNLILPTALFLVACAIFVIFVLSSKTKKLRRLLLFSVYCSLFTVISFDLLRFGKKFTPFVKSGWLFPATQTIDFLKNDPEVFRFMTADRRVFPPNFSVFYRLQTVEGYDPLYLKRYGQLVAAWERGKPDISPFSFNRILRPANFDLRIADFLNVKYVLSLSDLNSEKLDLVFKEGETRVYENKLVFPRAFWVAEARIAKNDQEEIDLLFDPKIDLRKTVILGGQRIEDFGELGRAVRGQGEKEGKGRVEILDYQENRVVLEVESGKDGIVVLVDSFYPGWKAEVDGEETNILRANFAFRALRLPPGKHRVVFSYKPASFKIGALLGVIGIIGLFLVLKKCLILQASNPT